VLEVAPAGFATTSVLGLLTSVGNTFADGDRVYFRDLAGGTGLVINQAYYIRDESGDTYRLSTTPLGTAIVLSTNVTSGTIGRTMTGLISGAITVAGQPVSATVTAANKDGSVAIVIIFATAAASGSLRSGIDLIVDVDTGAVAINGSEAQPFGGEVAPLFTVTEGDGLLLYVQFRRGETTLDLGALSSLRMSVKNKAEEDELFVGGGADTAANGTAMGKLAGTPATYVIYTSFSGDALTEALDEAEQGLEPGQAAEFVGLAQLTRVEVNAVQTAGGFRIGPATVPRTSISFPVRVVRDFNDNS